MSEELKFASTEEAMQYMANLTGKQVKIAGEETDKEFKEDFKNYSDKLAELFGSMNNVIEDSHDLTLDRVLSPDSEAVLMKWIDVTNNLKQLVALFIKYQ